MGNSREVNMKCMDRQPPRFTGQPV